eukprot:scaffold241356_cov27-Prasinocladus_malaysianus.AAC.1
MGAVRNFGIPNSEIGEDRLISGVGSEADKKATLRSTSLSEIRNGFIHHRMFSYRYTLPTIANKPQINIHKLHVAVATMLVRLELVLTARQTSSMGLIFAALASKSQL